MSEVDITDFQIPKENVNLPGITTEQTEGLKNILRHFDRIKYAIVYGSRVVGEHRSDSDLDIALSISRPKKFILSDIGENINKMSEEILGLDVHLKVLEEINNPDLLNTIKRDGVVVYRK